ncbi:MAG: hypothetical protein J6J61_04695, partial [Muribaculaceae bacterium]|nr:hypothetical protein [Muribaculaceae bacterium]
VNTCAASSGRMRSCAFPDVSPWNRYGEPGPGSASTRCRFLAGARRVEDGATLSHGSSASPPHAWAENCTPRSAGSLFFYI